MLMEQEVFYDDPVGRPALAWDGDDGRFLRMVISSSRLTPNDMLPLIHEVQKPALKLVHKLVVRSSS